MSISRKLMTVGGGEPRYVEDCFSARAYRGTASKYVEVTTDVPIGNTGFGTSTVFDGVTDAAVRASDLTGNANGRQFTFSAWVRPEGDGVIYGTYDGATTEFAVTYNLSNQRFTIAAKGGASFAWQTVNTECPTGRWYHLLVSGDLSDPTNKRHVYVNDSASELFNVSTAAVVEFANDYHCVGRGESTSQHFNGAIAHLYLDYTYRDLTVEGNRRVFNDGAGSSTSSESIAALSPILYMPLSDGSLENLGTGGSFTAEGSPLEFHKGVEAGEGTGGLLWFKARGSGEGHMWHDTVRGKDVRVQANTSAIEESIAPSLLTLTRDGVAIDTTGQSTDDQRAYNYWNSNAALVGKQTVYSFALQPGFFDIQTYVGNGVAGREIAHNLGSAPGMVVVKSTTRVDAWAVYHRSLGNQFELRLDTDFAKDADVRYWNNTDPTASAFTIGTDAQVNSNGEEYVAYIFAHDAQEFGPSSNESIIHCGSYTGNGLADGPVIDLGFEPQWLMVKNADTVGNWTLVDTARGISEYDWDNRFFVNTANTEQVITLETVDISHTGFKVKNAEPEWNESGKEIVFMAIRRPTRPAEKFLPTHLYDTAVSDNVSPDWAADFPVDMAITKQTDANYNQNGIHLRFRRMTNLQPFSANAIATATVAWFDHDKGFGDLNSRPNTNAWMFRRQPGFLDLVSYIAPAGGNATIPHALGTTPEMMWIKATDLGTNWTVYHSDLSDNGYLLLNGDTAETIAASLIPSRPTATDFEVGVSAAVNSLGNHYYNLLWASVPGFCDIGSYTGTGGNLNVDCGFTNGARFVLIKRKDDIGHWYYWDTLRGITAGDDPYLLMNSGGAQVTNTNYLSPLASGFAVNAVAPVELNDVGGEYIYMAIA